MTSTVPASPPVPLSRVPVGSRCVVRAVDDPGSPAAAELAREGLLPGSTIVVASRTPLGGPTVIALGRARLAVSADIASLMMTEPCPPDGSDDPSRPGESGLGAR